MLKKLANLFREFEADCQEPEKKHDYDAWAKRAFETIMGAEPDMDVEESAHRYPDVDKWS